MDAKVYGRRYEALANSVRMGETKVNLPAAASQCSHPADSLKPLDLIPDACMCSECGAIFKLYTLRQATLLGIPEGWTRLDHQLLQAEIYLAMRPVFALIKGIEKAMGALPFEELEAWADFAPHVYPAVEKLEKGE